MMTYQKKIGNFGEKIAADYLQELGYKLLDQQYTTRYGELDLVMFESGSVVFVEVKTRTTDTFGLPETSITQKKLERIQNAGLLWLQTHPEVNDVWRIDVISVILDHHNTVKDVQHFINVLS